MNGVFKSTSVLSQGISEIPRLPEIAQGISRVVQHQEVFNIYCTLCYAGGEQEVYCAHIFTIIHTNIGTCCSAAWIPLGASCKQCREGSCLAVKILIYSAMLTAWKIFLNCTPRCSPSSLDICGTLRALPISRYLTNEKEKEPCVETASAIMLVSESVLSFDEECAGPFSFTILEPGHIVCTRLCDEAAAVVELNT
jgi:hypothetical protein